MRFVEDRLTMNRQSFFGQGAAPARFPLALRSTGRSQLSDSESERDIPTGFP